MYVCQAAILFIILIFTQIYNVFSNVILFITIINAFRNVLENSISQILMEFLVPIIVLIQEQLHLKIIVMFIVLLEY